MQLTRDFSTDEMKCPCCGLCVMNPGFMAALQTMRDRWAKPIKISSACRCVKHNAKVGGVADSQHVDLDGKGSRAADCEVSAADRYEFVKLAFEVGFRGIGVASGFVHLDTRENPVAFWKYAR